MWKEPPKMKNKKLESYKDLEKATLGMLSNVLEETGRQIDDVWDLIRVCRRYPKVEREQEGLGNLEEAVNRMLLDVQSQILEVVQIMKKAEEE